jgi:predicted O-methyltransferase YrrM
MTSLYSQHDLPEHLRDQILGARDVVSSSSTTTQSDLGSGNLGTSKEDKFFDSISMDEAVLLYSVVREVVPKSSMEIGFCCGGSGMAFLKAIQDNGLGHHYACDPYQSTYAKNRGLENVRQAKLDSLLTFQEAFPEAAVSNIPRVQFAFIDASHLYDLTMLDFVLVDKKLDVGGVVAFHDMWMPALQKVMRFLISNRGYKLFQSSAANQFLPIRTPLRRRIVSSVLRMIPQSSKIFTQEMLHPWTDFKLGNVAILQKTVEDARDWRHFQPF